MFESAAHKIASHGVQFQVVLCRGEPSRVVREIVVGSVNFGFVVGINRIRLPISWPVFFASDTLSVWLITAGFQLEMSLCPADVEVLGNHSCLFTVHHALSEGQRRDSTLCQQVVHFVGLRNICSAASWLIRLRCAARSARVWVAPLFLQRLKGPHRQTPLPVAARRTQDARFAMGERGSACKRCLPRFLEELPCHAQWLRPTHTCTYSVVKMTLS